MKTDATAGFCRGRRGFTVVEVVMTMTLVAVFMAGAYQLIIQASKVSRSARNRYIAAVLCRNRLERARTFEYEDLHLLAENNIIVDDNGLPFSQGSFRRTTLVNTNHVPDPPIPGYAGGLTEVIVNVQVKNRQTGAFGPMEEELCTTFTEFLPPIP